MRNALSRVCAGVPQPCTVHAAHACVSRVRVCTEPGWLCTDTEQPPQCLGNKQGVCDGEGEHRSCAADKYSWYRSFGTHSRLTRAR